MDIKNIIQDVVWRITEDSRRMDSGRFINDALKKAEENDEYIVAFRKGFKAAWNDRGYRTRNFTNRCEEKLIKELT